MEDIKSTVAKNITDLRILNNMTQMELGAKLNYSDKTISKWERGESTPDIAVLVQIASLFGVSLDYLAGIENIDDRVKENARSEKKYNHRIITYIAEGAVWCVAVLAFIITSLVARDATFQWLYFVYALPIDSDHLLAFRDQCDPHLSAWHCRSDHHYPVLLYPKAKHSHTAEKSG